MDKIRMDEDLNKLNQNTWEAEEEKEWCEDFRSSGKIY